jgi:hypothetical protein
MREAPVTSFLNCKNELSEEVHDGLAKVFVCDY